MRSTIGTRAWLAAVALLATGPVPAAELDDDLEVVRRAVSSRGPHEAPAHAAAKPVRTEARPARGDAEGDAAGNADWIKVRIVSEDADGASLSLNVPLALVRAVDAACDDADDFGLPDILESLDDAGPLVSIDGDDARIRVWVE